MTHSLSRKQPTWKLIEYRMMRIRKLNMEKTIFAHTTYYNGIVRILHMNRDAKGYNFEMGDFGKVGGKIIGQDSYLPTFIQK